MSTYEDQVATCPTPIYHETHRYCPSCPWTEEGPLYEGKISDPWECAVCHRGPVKGDRAHAADCSFAIERGARRDGERIDGSNLTTEEFRGLGQDD